VTQAKAVHMRHKVDWPTVGWVFARAHRALAFGFGSGLIRPGSGTWGSVLGLLLWWPLSTLVPWGWLGVIVLVAALVGVWVCQRTTDELGVEDHVGIVWDEIAAVWAVLWAVPDIAWVWLLGFALFRLFDVFKPWPIRVLDEQVKGGLGIMVDDFVAAVYAVVLTFLVWFIVAAVAAN
jgi:phosphatidylglycerophosphatase A